MLDFYQLLSQGQILQLDKDVQVALVAKGDYESVYEDVNIKELSKLNERAEDLLNSLEYFAEMQLDKNRRSFLKKKILQVLNKVKRMKKVLIWNLRKTKNN